MSRSHRTWNAIIVIVCSSASSQCKHSSVADQLAVHRRQNTEDMAARERDGREKPRDVRYRCYIISARKQIFAKRAELRSGMSMKTNPCSPFFPLSLKSFDRVSLSLFFYLSTLPLSFSFSSFSFSLFLFFISSLTLSFFLSLSLFLQVSLFLFFSFLRGFNLCHLFPRVNYLAKVIWPRFLSL